MALKNTRRKNIHTCVHTHARKYVYPSYFKRSTMFQEFYVVKFAPLQWRKSNSTSEFLIYYNYLQFQTNQKVFISQHKEFTKKWILKINVCNLYKIRSLKNCTFLRVRQSGSHFTSSSDAIFKNVDQGFIAVHFKRYLIHETVKKLSHWKSFLAVSATWQIPRKSRSKIYDSKPHQ